MAVLNYYSGGDVKKIRAQKAKDLRDLDREHDKQIRAAITELKRVKVKALREEKRAAIKAMREEHKRAIGELRAKYDAQIAKLLEEAEAKRAELRASQSWRKFGRQRSKGRVTGAERRQEIDEAVENDIRAWRPELVPLWRSMRVGFANRPNLTRFEAFQQWVHDTGEETITALLSDQAEKVIKTDPACEDAKDAARRGDLAAEQWAIENCGLPVSATRKRPKGSATSRTGSLYATGERPPEPGPKKKEPKERTKKQRGGKGQQSLSGGPLGAGFEDIPF